MFVRKNIKLCYKLILARASKYYNDLGEIYWVQIKQQRMNPVWTAEEVFILGVGAKRFTIADSVIVYALSGSVIYGLIG